MIGASTMVDCPDCDGTGCAKDPGPLLQHDVETGTPQLCERCESSGKVVRSELNRSGMIGDVVKTIEAKAEQMKSDVSNKIDAHAVEQVFNVLEAKHDEMKSGVSAKIDKILDGAKNDFAAAAAFAEYVEGLTSVVQLERVAKACDWLGRAALYRATALRLSETAAGGATVAAEGVAQAAFAAAKVGL